MTAVSSVEIRRLRSQARKLGLTVRAQRATRGSDARAYSLIDLETGQPVSTDLQDPVDIRARLWWIVRERTQGGRPTTNGAAGHRSATEHCRLCGTVRSDYFRFCRSCGLDLEADRDPTPLTAVRPVAPPAGDGTRRMITVAPATSPGPRTEPPPPAAATNGSSAAQVVASVGPRSAAAVATAATAAPVAPPATLWDDLDAAPAAAHAESLTPSNGNGTAPRSSNGAAPARVVTSVGPHSTAAAATTSVEPAGVGAAIPADPSAPRLADLIREGPPGPGFELPFDLKWIVIGTLLGLAVGGIAAVVLGLLM